MQPVSSHSIIWASSAVGLGVLFGYLGAHGKLFVWAILTRGIYFKEVLVLNAHVIVVVFSVMSTIWCLKGTEVWRNKIVSVIRVLCVHIILISTIFTRKMFLVSGLTDPDTLILLETASNLIFSFIAAWVSYRVWLDSHIAGVLLWIVALYISTIWAFNGMATWAWIFPYGGGYEVLSR